MEGTTSLNFASVDNGRVLTKNSGDKIKNIVDSISSVKNNIPYKLESRCHAGSTLAEVISTLDLDKTVCESISGLLDNILELYKNIDYATSSEIMKAFSQSLLLFDLGFISYEDLQNIYAKPLYVTDENGKMVPLTYDMMVGLYNILPIKADPLGGASSTYNVFFVEDPLTGKRAKLCGEFAFQFQAVVNILTDLGIHIPPTGGGLVDQGANSYHTIGYANDWDTGHSINIYYNNGAETVIIRQFNGEKSIAVTESAYNVFYNTSSVPIDRLLSPNLTEEDTHLYARIPPGTVITEEYQKYVVNGLDNVIQCNDVLVKNPSANNITYVSIDGNFVDVDKIYTDAAMTRSGPIGSWPQDWVSFEAHHVEAYSGNEVVRYEKVYDSTGSAVSETELRNYYQIQSTLNGLSTP